MRSRTVPHAMAALVAGVVFLSANTAPVVCAAVHHDQHASQGQTTAHHDHGHAGHAPAPDAGTPAVDGSHATPPGCADMGHCGIAVNGVTAANTSLHTAAPLPSSSWLPGQTSPHASSFSPPTPPPRA